MAKSNWQKRPLVANQVAAIKIISIVFLKAHFASLISGVSMNPAASYGRH